MRPLANVVGFDDGPFDKTVAGGPVPLLGLVYARHRLDGALTTQTVRDGDQATEAIARVIEESRFHQHIQCVMLQGITFGGFDVVDLPALHARLERPILVVARKPPRMDKIEAALRALPGAETKLDRLKRAGPMEEIAGVWVQRAGIEADLAKLTLELHTTHGSFPEPLRVAHLLAAAFATGHSHGSA